MQARAGTVHVRVGGSSAETDGPGAKPVLRWAAAVLVGLATAVLLVVAAVAAEGTEHLEARGIDAACSRAAQEASQETEHPAPRFPDIAGNVHEAAINCLSHWGITQGRDGRYEPRQSVRRDAMASFIARMLRPTDYTFPPRDESDPPAFPDIAGNVHEHNINQLADAGIVHGREDGTYAPSAPVSRAQMASYLVRALEAVTGEALTGDGADPAFPDTEGSVHEDNINALARADIVQGRTDGTYRPRQPVRRDAMASFIARSMDYLAEEGHWPVPTTVVLEPAEDTNPANFIHRLRGMVFDQWGQDPENGLYAADVRVEVYRVTDAGYTLVRTDRILSGLGGDLAFAYNAGAAAGDRDVVVGCPLRADEHPAGNEAWCAEVDTVDGEPAVVARADRGADAVTAAWTDPVPPQPATEGRYSGNVLAHHPGDALLDLQTAERPGAEDTERLVRLGYKDLDRFTVVYPHGRRDGATADEFACALQAGLDHGQESFPHLSVQYDPAGQSLFDLSTAADVGHCLFSHEDRASDDFPFGGSAQLTDVRAAIHDEFDRVVFELPGDPIGWAVRWEDDPRAAGSGEPVHVDGDAYLAVDTTAVARWAGGTYDGPDRIAINGPIATEAVLTGDFEGMTTWVIGLHHEAPFRVQLLDDPQRLVVDIAS